MALKIAISWVRSHEKQNPAIYDITTIWNSWNLDEKKHSLVLLCPDGERAEKERELEKQRKRVTFQAPKAKVKEHLHTEIHILVIPGRHAKDLDADRENFERSVLRFELLKCTPILAICGALPLFLSVIRHHEGIDANELRLKDVERGESGHSNRQGMIRLNLEGRIVYNVAKHPLEVEEGTLLSQHIPNGEEVNSVHSTVLREELIPAILTISARDSVRNTIECLESNQRWNGGPLLAVQFHAEAYCYQNESPQKQLMLAFFELAVADAEYDSGFYSSEDEEQEEEEPSDESSDGEDIHAIVKITQRIHI
ncbi:hypothetical protein PROFUN_15636 [Planoprotostelium fungivorum]|uniref:Glutamine amidotransferase domain-containing protein n=1 Tax=Planoprotostelium fungivorum TaxID=1890364 RepID=A0A2P6MTJ3_9EUKA|nr:hypothetical protein PROFUN_15636 [Planoprotostelium fungivorum]